MCQLIRINANFFDSHYFYGANVAHAASEGSFTLGLAIYAQSHFLVI